MMVVKDRETGALYAHMVETKGLEDKWIVDRIEEDIKDTGHGGTIILLKSDQEPAIVAVQDAVIRKRPGEQSCRRFSI